MSWTKGPRISNANEAKENDSNIKKNEKDSKSIKNKKTVKEKKKKKIDEKEETKDTDSRKKYSNSRSLSFREWEQFILFFQRGELWWLISQVFHRGS